MSRFELKAMLEEPFAVNNLWKMVRYCYEIPTKSYDMEVGIVHCALERLVRKREDRDMDAELADAQDAAFKELAKKVLVGNKGAMLELLRFSRNLK